MLCNTELKDLRPPPLQAGGAGTSVFPGKPALQRWQRAADGAEAETQRRRTGRRFG